MRAGTLVRPALALALLVAACSSDAADQTTLPPAPAPTTSSAATPVTCETPTALFVVAETLAGSESPCRAWVDIARGRAIDAATASATVWSRRTEHGTALIVGAVHTLGLGWFGPADTAVVEAIVDPADFVGVPRLFLVRPDGSGTDDLATPWFAFYNPAIAAERNNNLLHDLLPREDFYVAVADAQKLDFSGLPPEVDPLVRAEVPLYDPAGVTTTDPTWAEAVPGDLVLALGYPNATGELSASVGRVLSDVQAQQVVADLAERGDVEGSIAYDADAEMIIRGEAVAGMSGGGVIDRDGRLVGILVRATDIHDGAQWIRAVRMSWVVARLREVLDTLDTGDREQIAVFVEPLG